jgi:hypothetical protein
MALGALTSLVLGTAALVLDLALGGGPGVFVLAIVLLGLGLAGMVVALGLWRRRRWAWMAALVLEGISVVQVMLAVASSGVEGALSLGLSQLVIAPLVFFYLTRPHVAAAFGHRGRPRRPG